MSKTYNVTGAEFSAEFSVPQMAVGKIMLPAMNGNVIGLTELVGGLPGVTQELSLQDCYDVGPGQYVLSCETFVAPFSFTSNVP